MTGGLVVTGGLFSLLFILHSYLRLCWARAEINRERENGWLVHRLVASRFHVLTHRDRSTVNTSRSHPGPFILLHV